MAQLLQLRDVSARGVVSIALVEVRGPQLLIGDMALEHVRDDDQDGVRDGHDRP
jgi:hypothetical protein